MAVATGKKVLGKGLSALLSDNYTATAPKGGAKESGLDEIAIYKIRPGKFQPRHNFPEEQLRELSESIQKNGIMQPILLRLVDEEDELYEIIAGERRWRAARLIGLEKVPAIVRNLNDQQALEIALIENIQRQDLTPLEEAAAYQRLIQEYSYTQEALSKAVGKSRSHIANLLRLLSLPENIKGMLNEGKITMGHARALLSAEQPEVLAKEIVEKGLNVRKTESLAKKPEKQKPEKAKQKNSDKDRDILTLEETLSENLGVEVSIHDHGKGGEVVIAYHSLEQLDNVLRRLGGGI